MDNRDRQAESVEKHMRKVRRLQKELKRRTEGGANWNKTKDKLTKAREQLQSAVKFYRQENGADPTLIGEANAILRTNNTRS